MSDDKDKVPDEFELSDDERFKLKAFLVRQHGFKTDEIAVLFPTDADLVRVLVLSKRIGEKMSLMDCTDTVEFPEDVFGEVPSDSYKMDIHDEREADFYAGQHKIREEHRKEILKKIEEMKKETERLKREAEEKEKAEGVDPVVEGGEDDVSRDIPEAEKADEKDSPVTREEMRAALRAIMEDES